MFKWIVLFTVLIVVELADEVGPLISPSFMMFEHASIIVVLITVLIFSLFLRGIHRTTKEFQKNQQKLSSIFDTLDVAIWSHDLGTDELLISPGIEKLYGYSLHDFYQDHYLWKKVILPEDRYVLKEREQALLSGKSVTSIYRIVRPDGEIRWIQDRGIPILDSEGRLADFNSVLFDITDRKESEDRYRSLVEMSPDIIAVVSEGKIDYINEAGCKLIGAGTPCELVGRSAWEFAPAEILEKIETQEAAVNQGKLDRIRIEFQVKRQDGKTIDVEMSAMRIFFEGRTAIQIVGRDITERKKTEKTIKQMAYYDTLTGLPNRNKFRRYLNEVLHQKINEPLAILFLDLDRFKIINDTQGHNIGDIVLQKAANLLERAVGNEGMASRQGGDEFIILLENANKEKVRSLAQRILDDFSKPIDLKGQEFFVTPSIGISMYPSDGEDEAVLLKNADTAMYLAKEKGKNNFQFYSKQLDKVSVRAIELENGLRKALEKNELILHYQPQINLKTGKLVGIEALIRWKHPKHGFLPPSEFIPLAEESGLIVPIGKWVLKEACDQCKKWQQAGLEGVPMAVNISVRQFQDEQFVQSVVEILDETGFSPYCLDLEITESIMQNYAESKVILNELKELGISLSIDDFGTGYSSLSYLKHLPIDKIKIDKSFVDDIDQHASQGAMVKSIIDMGHNLNFSVVAEGVETEEQVRFLKENACEIAQGYYYSKPLPAEQMGIFIRKTKGIPV